MESWGGFLSDTLGKTVKETLDKETDQVVLYAAIDSLSSCGEDPYFCEVFYKMAENENPLIREQAAYAIGNRWSIGAEGMEEAIVKLMKDEDITVQETACSRAYFFKIKPPMLYTFPLQHHLALLHKHAHNNGTSFLFFHLRVCPGGSFPLLNSSCQLIFSASGFL